MCSMNTEIIDQKNRFSPTDVVLQTLKELLKSIGVNTVVLNMPSNELSTRVYCSCDCYCFESYLLFRNEDRAFLW